MPQPRRYPEMESMRVRRKWIEAFDRACGRAGTAAADWYHVQSWYLARYDPAVAAERYLAEQIDAARLAAADPSTVRADEYGNDDLDEQEG